MLAAVRQGGNVEGLTYIEQCSGSKIQLARSKESGRVVNVDSVRRGKECDCVCLGCGEPVVANQGEIRVHYFSHLPDSGGFSNRPCKQQKRIFETLSHEMGKYWVEEMKELEVPPYFHKRPTDRDGCTYNSVKVLDGRKLVFDKVVLENWREDNRYRPDCIGYIGDQPVVIEIYVTHKVDEDKLAKIRADGLPAVEVVLKHGVFDESWESIDKAMRSNRTVRWLNCPEGETAEKRKQSEAVFNRQRAYFDQQQEQMKLQRRRKARSEAVIEAAEQAYESAVEEVPGQAKARTDAWKQRNWAQIKLHRDALLKHAAVLDELLLIERRKQSQAFTRSHLLSLFDGLATTFEKKINEAVEWCERDMVEVHNRKIKEGLSFDDFKRQADQSIPPVHDEQWRYAENIEEDEDSWELGGERIY